MIYSVTSRCSLPELFYLKSLEIFFAGVDPAVKVVQYYGYTKASQRHFCHIMAQEQLITPDQQGFPPARDPIYLRDWCLHPLTYGVSNRIGMIRQAAQIIHRLWRAGYDLSDFSPLLWRFEASGTTLRLSVPTQLTINTSPLTLDQLTRRFVSWRLDTLGKLSESVTRAFIVSFLKWEPLDNHRVLSYLQEIEHLVRQKQPSVLRDTLNRYAQRRGTSDPTAAITAYLTDLRIPTTPGPSPGETLSAAEWLAKAVISGDDWYGMTATWHDLLRDIQRFGFEVTRRPLLNAIQLSRSADRQGPWHPWIDPTTLTPIVRRRWFSRTRPLSDALEQEIHRLRQSVQKT